MLYGYSPRQNDSFQNVIELMALDAELLGVSVYSKAVIDSAIRVLKSRLNDVKTQADTCLAIIGLAEEFVQKQADVSDAFLTVFESACVRDPYKDVPERQEAIRNLKSQLLSYLNDSY